MLKDKIDEVTTAVEALYTLASKCERGQVIPWVDIEKIAGDRKENRSRHIINKWRRRLEKEREIVTLCADGVGVRLLTHRETATEIPRIRQRRAYKQIRRAIKQTGLVNCERLSLAERKLLVAQRSNMADQRLALHRSQKQLASGTVVTEVNPRRKVTA